MPCFPSAAASSLRTARTSLFTSTFQAISLVFFTDTWRPDSFYSRVAANRSRGLHTLVLLDIKVREPSLESLARGKPIYEPPRCGYAGLADISVHAVPAEYCAAFVAAGTAGRFSCVAGL